MLNGFLTFYYGALNFSCYYRDSAPGGGLLGIVLMERTHAHKWTSLPGVTEGLGTGSVRPLFRVLLLALAIRYFLTVSNLLITRA